MYRNGSMRDQILEIMSSMPGEQFTIDEMELYFKLKKGGASRRVICERLRDVTEEGLIQRVKQGCYTFAGV